MSNYLSSKREEKQERNPKSVYTAAADEFKKLLQDTTHPDNQTDAYRKNVISILTRLCQAADEVDKNSPGEGIFGLIVLSLRTSLELKDKNLELRKEVDTLKREVARTKPQKTT